MKDIGDNTKTPKEDSFLSNECTLPRIDNACCPAAAALYSLVNIIRLIYRVIAPCGLGDPCGSEPLTPPHTHYLPHSQNIFLDEVASLVVLSRFIRPEVF